MPTIFKAFHGKALWAVLTRRGLFQNLSQPCQYPKNRGKSMKADMG
ncbi:MAG: hypothetical protein CLLPBCKN_006647 [Chroococcidiopsis cubana SAG 39.79]|nr:hypothetical protein [Chroococcidiopsis cubana SAG 39.79]